MPSSRDQSESEPPHTTTVTTTIDARLRATLARAAGLDPESTRVVAADVAGGQLVVEVAGERA